MKRRNFLKLLGIGLLPTNILPVQADTVEPTVETVGDSAQWMILRTPTWGQSQTHGAFDVEIDNQRVQCLQDETAEDIKRHIKWCTDMLSNTEPDSQFLLVSRKSKVIVTAPDGQQVWFHPQWNTVEERFETVSVEIETHHHIFLDLQDEAGNRAMTETYSTTMCAFKSDGELITKSIRDW